MYVRRKASPGRADYYQLVESSRVNGVPRQRVVLHLGQHRTTEDALSHWPREISRLRQRGRTHDADALEMKLELLKSVLPHYQRIWRVSKGLKTQQGVRWAREKLRGYDWSKCLGVNVRWGKKTQAVAREKPDHRGEEVLLLVDPYDSRPTDLRKPPAHTKGFVLQVRVAKGESYPLELHSNGLDHPFVMQDEDETLVFLIASLAALYLSRTGQIRGESHKQTRAAFLTEMFEEFRSFRKDLREGVFS